MTLRKNFATIRALNRVNKKEQKKCIGRSSNSLIKCLSECAWNILHGKVRLNYNQTKKLRRYKTSLRLLGNRKASLRRKREVLQKGSGQVGGFLGTLVSVLAPLVGSLFGLGRR